MSYLLATGWVAALIVAAQDWRAARRPRSPGGRIHREAGTQVPLSLINCISTKHSAEGDRVYLETVFPMLTNGRIVVPVGSYVAGTVTEIKKPGRVKGRGELYVRFDSLTLPNGVTRDFHARIGSHGRQCQGRVGPGGRQGQERRQQGGDARMVGEAAACGRNHRNDRGRRGRTLRDGRGNRRRSGCGRGNDRRAGTRGPDAVLARGSTLEMVLDRPVSFTEAELNFGNYQPPRGAIAGTQDADPAHSGFPLPRRK